MGNVSVT